MLKPFELHDKAMALLELQGTPWSEIGPRRIRAAKVQGYTITHREPFTGATLGPDFFLKIEGRAKECLLHFTWYDEGDELKVVKLEAGDWTKFLDNPNAPANSESGDDIPF